MTSAVIFDFDLTLVDSSAGFLDCHAFAARTLGLPLPEPATILGTIGTPLPLAYPRLVGDRHPELVDEYIRLYQARADAVMTGLTVTLPGVRATLIALREARLPLAIVSQKLRYRIEAVLERDALRDFFSTLIGGEDLTALKPDPEGLLKAATGLGVAPAAALYVGDTLIDAEAAKRAGMPFVAVLSGVTPAEAFSAYEVRAVLDSVAGLPTLLREA